MEEARAKRTPPRPGRRKACAECRQQKMRCEDGPSDLDPPSCSRCHRLKIPCVFLAPFKRTHKRKQLQELAEENTALKRQLLSTSPTAPGNSRADGDTRPSHDEEDVDVSQNPPTRVIPRHEATIQNDPTMLRTIEGLELAPGIIDDCFQLYFRDYHPIHPILDPTVTPNTMYQHAPFLFWVVVSIGSRRYNRQPTLTQALALPVIQLASQSIIVRPNPVERMKGLMLLLNWPFPSGPFYRDPSFLLAGTLLHMAMQCGLHAPNSSQEFSKTNLRLPEQDPLKRAELWAYIAITYQRTCTGSGQANLVSFEIYHEQIHLKTLLGKLPVTLRMQIQISDIITRAHKSLMDLGLLSMTPQQERTMDALLKGFNTELDGLENLASSAWDRFYIASARQDLVAMHFYKSATTLDVQSCLLIFNTTSSALEQVLNLDRDYNVHRICTRSLLIATIMSLFSIARVLRGPFAGYLDQARGYDLFDAGVQFVRSCSIMKSDYAERGAVYSERMWRSKKVFRNPDGSTNITLRVRNRLSGGPLHDTIRCWRDEFMDLEYMLSGATIGAEPAIPADSSSGLDATLASSSVPGNTLSNFSTAPDLFLNDELWGDLGLGLTDNWETAGSSMSSWTA